MKSAAFSSFLSRFVVLLLAVVLWLFPQHTSDACMGTPAPPCGRSVFLAKFTPGVVVFPAGGGAINVPIGVLPFANWNTRGLPNNPRCPQPTAATLTLTLICQPSGAIIGPLAFPVPVPTNPGAQPLGGPVNFVIPAGVFPAGSPPQVCLVRGTYSVTFSDNITLVANGDTEVCIVPPSPLDDSAPQLDMQYLSLDGEGYRTCRRGDQANFYFLIANNDPDQSVTLDFSSIGRQVAHLPEGFDAMNAYGSDVYSISLPQDSTDTFAAAFGDELMPGELLAEPDPMVPSTQSLTRSLTLGPCEATIVSIAMRSFGMCANGSCNERLAKVTGTFADGSPALACASTLYLVGEVDPKSVLCEVADSVKVNPEGQATWSPANYFGQDGPFPHAQSFAISNLPPSPSASGYLTTGDQIADLFPAMAADYTRIDGQVLGVDFTVNYNSPQCGGGLNIVSISGLNVVGVDRVVVPAITYSGITSPLEIQMDLTNNQLTILAQGEILFEGPIDLFFVDPPPYFCIDPGICRVFNKRFNLTDKAIYAVPPTMSRLFEVPVMTPSCDTLDVRDNNTGMAPWDAIVSGGGLTLPNASGVGMLEYCYDNLDVLPKVPATSISFVDITCPDALSGLRVPVAIRVKSTVIIGVNDPEASSPTIQLHTAIPNPFSGNTQIRYTLPEAMKVELTIFNGQGQVVRKLQSGSRLGAGTHTQDWDATNGRGLVSPNGLYFCQLRAGETQRMTKLILLQ